MRSLMIAVLVVGYGLVGSSEELSEPPLDHVVSITASRAASDPEIPNKTAISYGTGFIYQGQYVVTSYHVVQQGRQIILRTIDQKDWNAKIVGFDDKTDLALLEVKDRAFQRRRMGLPITKQPPFATPIMALGNSYGKGIHVTTGKVDAVDHPVEKNGALIPFLRATAPATKGFSGGPIVVDEKVVGIITDISASTTDWTYAVDGQTAKRLVDQWIKRCAVPKPKVGARAISSANRPLGSPKRVAAESKRK